jgi:hypothetical protein
MKQCQVWLGIVVRFQVSSIIPKLKKNRSKKSLIKILKKPNLAHYHHTPPVYLKFNCLPNFFSFLWILCSFFVTVYFFKCLTYFLGIFIVYQKSYKKYLFYFSCRLSTLFPTWRLATSRTSWSRRATTSRNVVTEDSSSESEIRSPDSTSRSFKSFFTDF